MTINNQSFIKPVSDSPLITGNNDLPNTWSDPALMHGLMNGFQGIVYQCQANELRTIEYISPGCKEISGYEREAFSGINVLNLNNLVHADDMIIIQKNLLQKTHQNKNYQIQYRIHHKDGGLRVVQDSGQIIYNDLGKQAVYTGYITDITPLAEKERQLTLQNQELQKVNAELDRFVYSASHEIRGPLMSILGLMNLATDEDVSLHEIKDYCSMVKSRVNMIDNYVRDIIHYAQNVRLEQENQIIDLKQIFQDAIIKQAHITGESKIMTQYLETELNLTLYSDYRSISLIINNLVNNAYKFYRADVEEPYVIMQVQRMAYGLCIIIYDNGQGIECKQQKKVWDMFYRGQNTASGSGLGLYLVKEVIQRLNGEVMLYSRPKEGTQIGVYIPDARRESKEIF
ncbi:MAG: PAS domain-containing sensor histidine kinase [Bacteroidota bacterium]|nr:PAS domain-containing sensor histidine kinase [Bacteroidota bacterium]